MSLVNEPNDVTGMYEVLFNTENDTAPVRILEGTFKDFVYKYGAIQVGKFEGDPSDVPLKFEYTLLEAPESYEVDEEEAEQLQFEQLCGDILYDIIVNSDTVKDAKDGNRNNDSK